MVLAVLAASASAGAQGTAIIRGDVTHSDGATRVPGVVVVASDSGGTEVARSLSGPGGGYSLAVSAPASYVIKALRIGYRPTVLPAIRVAPGETRTVNITLTGDAIHLDAVRVQGETTCRTGTEVGRVAAELWEQARGALTASMLAAGGVTYHATLERFQQFTPKGETMIRAETVTVIRGTTTGFASVVPESLAANGYVVMQGTQFFYHAPDAGVLLSPSFAATHCFEARAGEGSHRDWIGIGFRQALQRRNMADIEGTLWLDRKSAELRRLEYKYNNLPAFSGFQEADGWVEFLRLATGDWIVRRWSIRTPVTEERIGALSGPRFGVLGTRVVGGVTRAIEQDGVPLHADRGATLTVAVKERDDANAALGTRVDLVGTGRPARHATSGTVAFDSLNAGHYRVNVHSGLMRLLGAPPIERDATVEFDASNRVEVALPSGNDVAQQQCRTASDSTGHALYGYVRHAAGSAAPDARIVVDWTPRSGGSVGAEVRSRGHVELRTDPWGLWATCVSSTGEAAAAIVTIGDVVTRQPFTMPTSALTRRVDVRVP